MPKVSPPAARRSLTPDAVKALMVAAKGERLEGLITVGLVVGLRPGKLTGLLWADFEQNATPPTLTVSGSMKRQPAADGKGSELTRGNGKRSTGGRRTVALPPMADTGFPYLLPHTAVSLLIDSGAGIEEVADLLGDDPRTLYRHYRHKVRLVAETATGNAGHPGSALGLSSHPFLPRRRSVFFGCPSPSLVSQSVRVSSSIAYQTRAAPVGSACH